MSHDQNWKVNGKKAPAPPKKRSLVLWDGGDYPELFSVQDSLNVIIILLGCWWDVTYHYLTCRFFEFNGMLTSHVSRLTFCIPLKLHPIKIVGCFLMGCLFSKNRALGWFLVRFAILCAPIMTSKAALFCWEVYMVHYVYGSWEDLAGDSTVQAMSYTYT